MIIQLPVPYVVLNWFTAAAALNMMTLSNAPFGEEAGAIARVPADPKFKLVRFVPAGFPGDPLARKASAVMVLMVYVVPALPVNGYAVRVTPVAIEMIDPSCFISQVDS